ncbi:sugar ABC transporter permease [Paenibacillus pectinilyticus]|uniref:Sugar ABC transporter permease n=1 Tax=Paenibacillus pectinilyticus TaxID=512399 RepID=A0A1C1A7Y9_9BACL|nr:carbohydrate ABC transporter permease [Paenibacillus pectinilyticus]OCT16721.1 sugar ABC transporter permease [Paenibacillus pectinilyticus]
MNNENKGLRISAHVIFSILIVCVLAPFVLLLSSSFSDEGEILRSGYSFWPKSFSLAAYNYLFSGGSNFLHAYGITVIVTIIGTVSGLLISAMLAYPLSRQDYPANKLLSFLIFFTIIFNGGLIPTYLVYTQLLDIKNTIWALIIPSLLMNGFNIMLIRTFFRTSIPPAIIESASIDGASEFRIFYSIVLRLSAPVLATVGILQATSYWNDWMNGKIYLTNTSLYGIQSLLNRILEDQQFLASSNLGANASLQAMPLETVKMAVAVIGVIPLMIAYPFFQKYFVKGIVAGSVKG